VASVRVTLLGGFAAAVDGTPVPESAWRLRKARELVKLLALAQGHRLHREQAMDVLWPDRDPAAAVNNLHQAVHVARRALDPGAIELRDEVLTLHAEIDVEAFELAADRARRLRLPAAYRGALAAYGGELLPENRYDDWAEERRDDLAALADDLTAELDELGAEHSDRPFSVPVDASSFVGRARELAELEALLRRTRLLTLAGTGGAGKTRLALELARSAEASYPGGAALVELAALTESESVAEAVARALDVQALPGQEPVDAVVDFLTPRAQLLLLDTCEHLVGAVASLAETLLRAAPDLTIVTTSREPLHVAGEVVFRVPSLDIPDPELGLGPDELLAYESVRLFVERAVAAARGFALDEENATDVARICFRLDGLPLALELAAGRIGALDPADVAERLDDRFRLLRRSGHASPTRQHALRATLQWSHDLLLPDERLLFRRLAIFAGSFDLAAAERVCVTSGLETEDVADVLARLVEKSLVTVDEHWQERRYRLLDTVHLYAKEQLRGAGEEPGLAERHARWALQLALGRGAAPSLDGEAPNMRAALDTLLATAPVDALRLATALCPFWLRRIELREARRRFAETLAAAPARDALRWEALLAAGAIEFRSGALGRGEELALEAYEVATEIGDPHAQWRALQRMGEFGIASDAADVTVPWIERGLEVARREGVGAWEAIGIYSLGVAHWTLGDLGVADEHVGRSVEILRGLDPSERIPSPTNIAEIRATALGDRPNLPLVFEDTLQPFAEISCGEAVAYVLANQAGIARASGDNARARALLDESAARFEELGDERGISAVLVRRAYLDLTDGDRERARLQLEQALELRRRLRDRRGVGLALSGLGLIETVAGDFELAEEHLEEALSLFRRAGDRWGLASTLWRTADLAFAREDVDAAEAALDEAFAVLAVTERQRWIANTLVGLSDVALLRGDPERATTLLQEAGERYALRDDGAGIADVETRLAALLRDR
jgi:predicted ATPase